MMPRHVVIVGYQDLMSLDVTGPLEAFSSARIKTAKGATEPGYKVTIAACVPSRSALSPGCG